MAPNYNIALFAYMQYASTSSVVFMISADNHQPQALFKTTNKMVGTHLQFQSIE